jgi:tRNA-dihydrouridine synthase B
MRIGRINVVQPFCQAGLAGYSDRAMRLVARRRGCGYAVTEALLDVIMLNGGEGLRKSIDINDEDHPIAGQLMGSEPEQMARAAIILWKAGYDTIDLNFACPVKKIKNKARGGHMLMDVPRARAIIKAVRDALPPEAPTSVKMRRGFDDSAEAEDWFHAILETVWENNYSCVCVHGRTVVQKYVGPSRWEFLRKLKNMHPDRTILGSGDVFVAEDAVRMLSETGVDGVWIARGAIGNPWIFRQAEALLSGATNLNAPTIQEQREALLEHFQIAMEIHGEQLAGRRMRKQGIKYSRFHPAAREVKEAFIRVNSLRDWNEVLGRWYAADGEGIWPGPTAVDEVNAVNGMNTCEEAA